MNLEQNIISKEHLQPQAVICLLTRTVHTVCVHVPIVHVLIIREELHKASRLHLRVHTWRGTQGQCATGREDRQRRTIADTRGSVRHSHGSSLGFCGYSRFTYVSHTDLGSTFPQSPSSAGHLSYRILKEEPIKQSCRAKTCQLTYWSIDYLTVYTRTECT